MDTETKPVKRRMGRPLKYESLEKLEADINDYFEKTPQAEWLITGLALHLGTSRTTLLEYEGEVPGRDKHNPDFAYAIKRAKEMVEMAYELDLRVKGNAGAIFGLKNFGWRDKTETEATVIADVTSNGETIADASMVAGFANYMKGGNASTTGENPPSSPV